MSDAIIVALISAGVSLAGSLTSMVVSSRKSKQQANLTMYRIGQLEEKVSKHNEIVERTYKLEGQMQECQHDIRDFKSRMEKYHS